jgi:hypothetical protein
MTDLNTLFPASSNLYATMANKINGARTNLRHGNHSQRTRRGNIHAFLATPVNQSVGKSGCRRCTYAPEIRFTREYEPTTCEETRPRPIRPIKDIFEPSAPCIPAIGCAKAQGRRLCVNNIGSRDYRVTLCCLRQERMGRARGWCGSGRDHPSVG